MPFWQCTYDYCQGLIVLISHEKDNIRSWVNNSNQPVTVVIFHFSIVREAIYTKYVKNFKDFEEILYSIIKLQRSLRDALVLCFMIDMNRTTR